MVTDQQGDIPVSDLPTVSVIIVNLNGRALLGDCLDSVAAQEYPSAQLQSILVDNGSTDDSLPFVRKTFPWVQIVEAGRNLGFAAASNLGARVATGDFLALLNNDARAAPGWLHAMVKAASTNPRIACIASKILDQNGKTIDFVGTAMNLYGRAFLPAVPQ
jgi:GT2 family glycosyltransferase